MLSAFPVITIDNRRGEQIWNKSYSVGKLFDLVGDFSVPPVSMAKYIYLFSVCLTFNSHENYYVECSGISFFQESSMNLFPCIKLIANFAVSSNPEICISIPILQMKKLNLGERVSNLPKIIKLSSSQTYVGNCHNSCFQLLSIVYNN